MKKGERFRIAVETAVVLLLAVGVFRFYQVKQQQKTRDKEAPTLSDERGLGKLIKTRADAQESRSKPKALDAEGPVKLNDLSEEPTPPLLEPALLVIQLVDTQGAPFLEPVMVFSAGGRFTNRVVNGRLALSLNAITLSISAIWEAYPSVRIAPVSVSLKAGKSQGVVLIVNPGALPGFDLVRESDLLIVTRIEPGSPAALAGLQIDDIVVEVAGIPAEQLNDAALLGVLESPLTESLELTVAVPAGEGWTAESVILQP